MNFELYCSILEENLINSLHWYNMNSQQVVCQQYNDPKHSARRTLTWFQHNNVEVLNWLAQYPDLNPIELFWNNFKRRLFDYPAIPSSTAELWERLDEEWNKITQKKCVELIDSMPRRITVVIEAKLGQKKY